MDEGVGDAYTWDAPSHVIESVDGFAVDPQDNADQWFELRADADSGVVEQLTTPSNFQQAKGTKVMSSMIKPSSSSGGDSTDAPTNIVTSWGNGKATGQAQMNDPAQPRRVLKRPAPKTDEAAVHTTPAVKKRRVLLAATARMAFRRQRRSSTSKTKRVSAGSRRSVRLRSKPNPATELKSTEQLQLDRIEALQREAAEHRRKNEASYKAALAGGQLPKKQVLSTTVPKEFSFRSDSRLKNAETTTAADQHSHKEKNFTSQLRAHRSSLKALKPTIPKPFNLSRGKGKTEEATAYVPMAQQIEQFEKRTPTRYHQRSRQNQERGPSPVKSTKPKITHPMTPKLLTRQRTRGTAVKSTEEMEAEELEKIHQHRFKAQEVNHKILEGTLVPIKPAVKEVTKPVGFQLELEKRLQERQSSKKPEEPEDYKFHSNPVPVQILEKVMGVPDKKVINPTVPESPAFALKNRVRLEKKPEEEKPPPPIKALAVPHFMTFHPKLPVKSQVDLCPFSFEERDRERKAVKEKKLEELRNEEVPKFKARPLPDFSDVHLPEKKASEVTRPAPFKLAIDERGAAKSERWENMVKEELKLQAEAACFKARPNNILHKEPFLPKKENRLPVANATKSAVSDGFELFTERRAKERLEFERDLKEKEALRSVLEDERIRELDQQEREEVARLRHEQAFKAQPIRRYKTVELKKSEVPLTVPHSPKFSDRFHM